MAYYVNGKTYTDHPLMDEICYNCKTILKSIVIKNDILANNNETETSVQDGEMYQIISEKGYIDFNEFYFSRDILKAFGYSEFDIRNYLEDRTRIPVDDRDSLTEFANNYFKDNFEEKNDYYRMLMGMPPYNTGSEYYIMLSANDIPSNYTKQVFLDVPLHEQPKELIDILYENGTIDILRNTYRGSSYSYMMYLGNRSIDLYTARIAAKWDILYMPNVYYLVEDKFIDLYKINRETYMDRSYQEFFSESGDYYDQMMILIVLAQTFADMVTDVPEWYIRRDIFDLRSCKYFLESSGVDYYKIIPLKYQIRIVKNLNTLIKYKSSNKNAADIIDIFDVPNTKIYKYWLYKKKDNKSDSGYSLEFISSDYTESYDRYIKDTKYRTPYDDITLSDKYWDGEDNHDYVKEQILDLEFTINGTKYMSVEYQVSMREYLYQTEYMLGLILDSNIYESLGDVKIAVPSINEYSVFKIADLFLFLVIMSNSFFRNDFNSSETAIKKPDDMSEGSKPTVNEKYYDWMVKYFPEMFVVKNGRIKGFNSTLDKSNLVKILERRHSHLRFGLEDEVGEGIIDDAQYIYRADEWLTKLGVDDFIVPGSSIHTIEDLVSVYNINTKVHDNIRKEIINSSNRDDKKYLEYIYQELFTRPYDTGFYTYIKDGKIEEYRDMIKILQNRDYILYDTFISIMSESNIDTKQDLMRNIMNDVIDTLEYYLSGDGIEYLYSFVSIESFGSIINYIYLMLCFFKSYKVYFLDPYYTLQSDDEIENTARPIDKISEYKIINYKWDKSHVADKITGINIMRYINDEGEYDRMFEIADIYSYYDPDPLLDFDIDGINAEKGETEDTIDVDGGLAKGWKVNGKISEQQYVTLNAGHSYLGMLDMSDMNGSHADEKGKEYYSIDGGQAHDPYVNKTDAMGSQMFNYMIDGGSADGRRFINNSIDIKLIGTELQANAVISPRPANTIKIKPDGLYVSDDAYCSITQFYNMVYTMDNILQQIRSNSYGVLADLRAINNPDIRYKRIQSVIDPILYNMEYVNRMMQDDTFVKIIKKYIDSLVDSLNSEFSGDKLNPYAWEELD